MSGRDDQRRKIADAEIVEQHPGDEGAHHEERAMGEIDDVEQPEDHREAKREHGVEGAIDQPEQQLPVHQRRGEAENRAHRNVSGSVRTPLFIAGGRLPRRVRLIDPAPFGGRTLGPIAVSSGRNPRQATRRLRVAGGAYALMNGHPPSASGRKASEPGVVASSS